MKAAMYSHLKKIASAACGMLVTASVAHAHYLWIEADEAGGQIYFGEAQELLKEKSPGKLDNIKAPKAFVQAAADEPFKTVEVSRRSQFFTISASKNAAAIAVVEESLEVKDLTKHSLGFAKSNYYARYGKAPDLKAEKSMMPIDLQQRAPNVFAVSYRGQPLANAKLEVIAPNTWVQEHKTDAQGTVEINTPWRGQYVVHLLHVEKMPGEYAGKRYDALRNHFTYTFTKADGADAGSALPPKQAAD